MSVNALFSRAYNLIWNEWFRDQNLQNSATVDTGDGPDVASNYVLRRRNKKHDYFTGCLPWPQKGAAIQVPLGSQAYVKFDTTSGVASLDGKYATINRDSNSFYTSSMDTIGGAATPIPFPTINMLYADLSTATASTVNQLRESFQLQRLLERDARAGTRYTEIIEAHFGVTSPDARLQRPEYLGGSSTRININTVAQTSVANTTYTTPLS